MGRAHHMGKRERKRFRSSSTAQSHPRFVLVFGSHAGAPSSPASSSLAASPPYTTNNEPSLATVFTFPHYSIADRDGSSTNSLNLRSRYIELEEPRSSNSESLDTFKSCMVATSSRYKESLTKSTKGFRERLQTRGGIMQDLGARAWEMSVGIV